ncbi:MAG: translocation/assembly module TamB domain-containing protein [Polyangiaceae bacterium]
MASANLMAKMKSKPSRLRRYAKRVAIGMAGLLGFALLAVLGVRFSLRFAAVRGYIVSRANAALADAFKGKIVLHGAGSLSLAGIGAVDAEIFDPAGHRVVDIHGLDAHLSVPTVVWAALTNKSQPLTVRLDSVSVAHAEVVLIDNGAGSPTLADTFMPKTPSAPSAGPGTVVILERVDLKHVWAHGSLGGSPPLDVELKKAVLTLRTDDRETAIEVKHTDLVARGLPAGADPVGELQASLTIPAAADKALSARAHYAGSAAAVPVVFDASYINSKLAAKLEAKNIPPEVVAKQVPGLELRSPASLSASAEGKLPDLHGTFLIGVGAGNVDGDFDLLLQDDTKLKANVKTHDFNLSEVSRNAPPSSLDLTLRAGALVPKRGPITGNFALTSQPSVVLAEELPGLVVNGTFASNAQTHLNRVEAHAEIAEPGAQTSVDANVSQGKTTSIEFRSTTQLSNPPRLKKLAALSRVQGQLAMQGTYQVESQAVNAQVDAALQGLRQGENRVGRLKLSGTVSGALPHPNADLRLGVDEAVLSGQQIQQAQLSARGSLSRLALSGEVTTQAPERHVQVSAFVSNERGILIDHPSVNLRQGKTNLNISAVSVSLVDGRTSLRGLHLDGAGKADVSLEYGKTLESVNAQTYELDLARLWRLVDPKAPLKAGTATVSATYESRAGNSRLRLLASGRDLTLGEVKDGSFAADFQLDQGRLNGSASANLKQLGELNLELQELRGIDVSNLDPAHITGKLAAEGQIKLKDLLELVPKDVKLPIARALGVIKYDLTVERAQAGQGLPALHVHISTDKMQLAGTRTTKSVIETREEAIAAAPPSIKGYDIDVDLRHAETGESDLAGSVTDDHGKLLSFSVEGKSNATISNVADQLSNHWRELPLSVRLTLPERKLQQLPMELRPSGLNGLLSAELAYNGTLDAPDLKMSGRIVRFRQMDVKNQTVDLAFQANYSNARGKATASVRSKEHEVATADVDFETAIPDWLNQIEGKTPHLAASAHLAFDEFPIGLLPPAKEQQLSGNLSGKLALENFGSDAAVDVNLDMQSLKLANNDLGRIHSEISARGGKADAKVEVFGKDGTTTAEAHSGLDWGARLVPEIRMPADASLKARELHLAAFSPLTTSVFGELDGRLNGDLNAHFHGGPPDLDGRIDVKDGVAQVAALGQRFDQMTARLSLESGKAKLEEFSARATAGKVRITGEARFVGLDLAGADAKVRIAKKERVSLALAGQELDQTWGAIDIAVRPGQAQGSQTLTVNMGEFHVHMPDTGSKSLQDLDPATGVRVGTYQRDGGFVTLPLQPLKESDPSKNDHPLTVDLNLGSQLWVAQGDTTQIQLGGKLKLVLGDPMTMTGQVQVQGGKLDVSGKQFQIEGGTVTFSGEPANPSIVATASWDAADDEHHRVYAEASGTASDLKVNLRSEPPLTKDQVLSLIVTGSADGSLAGGGNGSGTAGTAVGAVGGAATQGVNKALSNISDLDVSTRIDTSTGSARPEIVVRLSAKVSAQITRALGEPAPGTPPDLTFLTLSFRLKRNWSLSALVGDRGESGLDLVWRKRY